VTVPDEIGKTADDAKADLESQGLNVVEQTQFTFDSSQYGHVIDQDPKGGTTASRGDTVTIYVGCNC
jgi:beta-lactam-binding protein with PASTA domain